MADQNHSTTRAHRAAMAAVLATAAMVLIGAAVLGLDRIGSDGTRVAQPSVRIRSADVGPAPPVDDTEPDAWFHTNGDQPDPDREHAGPLDDGSDARLRQRLGRAAGGVPIDTASGSLSTTTTTTDAVEQTSSSVAPSSTVDPTGSSPVTAGERNAGTALSGVASSTTISTPMPSTVPAAARPSTSVVAPDAVPTTVATATTGPTTTRQPTTGPTTTAGPTVTTTRPTTAPTARPTTAPTTERPSRPGPIRVATLGDSNTESGFWRASFQNALSRQNCAVDMIGHREVAWTARLNGHDLRTDAVSGAFLATSSAPSNAIFGHGAATLASGEADIVIIVGGTNDVLGHVIRGDTGAEARSRLTTSLAEVGGHLDDALDLSPAAVFFVADIVKMRDGEDLVAFYNSGLAGLAAEAGGRVHHIGIGTSLSDLADDGVHFTESGARVYGAAIAGRVLGVARNEGLC